MAMNTFITLAMVILTASTSVTEGQQEVPPCAAKLAPCAGYLNSTTAPPESCCGPLKEAVKNEMPCLCKLYHSPDLLKAFGINITQVMALPKLCGVHMDQTACQKTSPNTTTTSTGSGSSEEKETSGTFGGPTSIGMSVLFGLVLICWSIVAL